MEHFTQIIISLVTTIIFISAVEIIAPDNSIKKYIKYVLGLILISVMLNPIVYIFTKGESDLIQTITEYENMLYEGGEKKEVSDGMKNEKEELFKKNLNNNCDALLKEQFDDKDFKSDIQCTFNYDDMTYTIDKINVAVGSNGIKLIEKVNINLNETQEATTDNEKNNDIKEFLCNTFKVPTEKIEIYDVER